VEDDCVRLTRRSRWAVPPLAAALIAALSVAPSLAGGGGTPRLPSIDTLSLLDRMTHPQVAGLEGTLTVTTDLGLPAVPSGDFGSAPLASLLQGSTPVELWAGRRGDLRIAVLGQLSEEDLIRSSGALWLYDSVSNTAQRLSGTRTAHAAPGVPAAGRHRSRGGVAHGLLATMLNGTRLSGRPPVDVAGQPCYQLVITPRAADTTVSRVQVAVDAVNGVPLKIAIYGRNRSTPAITVGFDSVGFQPPPGDLVHFHPPPGSRRSVLGPAVSAVAGPSLPARRPRPGVRVFPGDGWDAVLELPLGPGSGLGGLVHELSGSRVLSTPLLSALVAPGGLYVGAVPVSRLRALAGGAA
jgi:hypothetical protein